MPCSSLAESRISVFSPCCSRPVLSSVRSILLRTKVTWLRSPLSLSTISGHSVCGSVVFEWLASTSIKIRSALLISCQARSIPICSTRSGASRRPAVSIMCSGIPSMCICSLNTSRVVPSMSVTMAESRPDSALSRLDLPALGRPAITTVIPSLIRLPCCAWP
ncbi:MAG: Uncharacterised protein [Marinobacterium sp. xm-d-530]|nr:MAG: Uncharacterised protein [Marinobacterium sp. xm-d-530]